MQCEFRAMRKYFANNYSRADAGYRLPKNSYVDDCGAENYSGPSKKTKRSESKRAKKSKRSWFPWS